MKKFLDGLPRPAAIAHRGGARAFPENTAVAFAGALQLGMDIIELDVHCTTDGHLVVAHDETVDRCTDGTGLLREMTLEKAQALDAGARFEAHRGRGVTLPTLEAVLHDFPHARLNIELKPDAGGHEQRLLDVLRAAGALERVCIGSEDDAVAERLRALAGPEVCFFYPAGAALQLAQGVWGVAELEADPRWDVLEVPRLYGGEVVTDARFFAACRSVGVPVFVWVVDEPEAMRQLIRDGAAGIMTDLPAVLRDVLSTKL